MALLKDQRFYELCQALQCTGQTPSDPDRKAIEKAFRKLALKTHPDKGGDPTKFRVVNDAYNKLIAHINRLERMEAESELRNTSVIIEISKQAMPKWWEKLKNQYGQPKSSDVKNTLFQGPYKQYKGRGKLTGPITLILYEDPEDKIPKIHCKCQNYMAWIQEQKMPLHLHVNRDKKVSFDQWRIMSLAEYDFINIEPSSSARHDWKSQSSPRGEPQQNRQQEQEEAERRAREAEEQKAQAKKAEEDKRRAEEEEAERKKQSEKEDERNKPWWHRYSDRYQGFNMGETTPPPDSPPPTRSTKDDGFPKVFNMTSNAFTVGGLSSNNKNAQTTDTMNAKESDKVTLQKPEKLDKQESLPSQTTSNSQPEQQTQDKSIPKVFESVKEPFVDQNSESNSQQNLSQTERSKTPPETKQENKAPKSQETPKDQSTVQMTREKIEIVELEVKLASIPEVVILEKPEEPIPAESETIILTTKATESDLKKRDLGKLAEKLVNKSKIKKIKSRKSSSKKLSNEEVSETDNSGECLENLDPVKILDNPGEADNTKTPNEDEKDKGPASNHSQNPDQSGHQQQEENIPDPGVPGVTEDSFTTIDHIDHSEKYVTLASGQVEPDVVTLATGDYSDIGQHLLTAGHSSTSVKADTEEIKVETQTQILISRSDYEPKEDETINVSLPDIQTTFDDTNLECDADDDLLNANDSETTKTSEFSNTSTPFYSPQVSVEDDEGILRHGFSDRRSYSIQRDPSTPTKLVGNKSLSPFSTEYNEPTRRLSHENSTPSRWRRGGIHKSGENDQSCSNGDVEAKEPSDGVVRSRSVHTLHAFQRESSPQRKTSVEENKLSSSSNIKQNYTRTSNLYTTSTPISHLPPVKPPPHMAESKDSASNHRARMLESNTLKKDLSTPPKPSLKATSTFTADHFLRSKPDNATEKSKQNDKIPSRFRRARDHATAASMTDLSKKPNDYSVFREQILLAKHEHQKLCDQALNFDPKRVRNSMNNGAAGRATTPGPTFFGPPPAMPAPPQDYQLRSSRFELKSDLSKSKSMRNLSAGYQIPSVSRSYLPRR